MGREKKADIRAERDGLANSAELAAKELGTIASEIEYAIAHLPRRTKNEYVSLLQQQADRAQALANAFAAEEKAPDPGIMRHLREVRGAFGLALFLALKSVVVGGLEHTGAEGVDAATPQIAALIKQANAMADPKPIAPVPDAQGHESTTEFQAQPGSDSASRQAFRDGDEFLSLIDQIRENPATLDIDLGDEAVTVHVNNGGDPSAYQDVGRALAQQGIALILANKSAVTPADWLEVGRAVRLARGVLGISQTDLASELQVSKQAVSGWEKGRPMALARLVEVRAMLENESRHHPEHAADLAASIQVLSSAIHAP